MAEIWRARDRIGREVIFTSEGRDHVLRKRPTMADRLEDIRLAIEQPDLVTRDVKYPRREVHYLRTYADPAYLKVVVNYRPVPPQGTWEGEIITAFGARRPKIKEEPLWP